MSAAVSDFSRVRAGAQKARCQSAPFLLLLILAACSPRFDWRDHRGAEGVGATFPARVQTVTRQVEIDGHTMSMRMDAARVDQLSFAITSVRLPDDRDLTRTALHDAIVHGVAASAGVDQPAERTPVEMALARGRAPIKGEAVVVSTRAPVPLRLEARVFESNGYVFEALVAGPPDQLQGGEGREAADTFFSSLNVP